MILKSPYFNKNPFVTEKDEEEEKKNREKTRILIKKKRDFIKENYKAWNFSEAVCLQAEYPEKPIRFFFKFREFSGVGGFDRILQKQKYIFQDGFIKEAEKNDFSKCASVKNRDEAVKILEKIKKVREEQLEKEVWTEFRITIHGLKSIFKGMEFQCIFSGNQRSKQP